MLAALLSLLFFFNAIQLQSLAAREQIQESEKSTIQKSVSAQRYSIYRKAHTGDVATKEIVISAASAVVSAGGCQVVTNYSEDGSEALYTDDNSLVSWTVTVPKDAYYCLDIE